MPGAGLRPREAAAEHWRPPATPGWAPEDSGSALFCTALCEAEEAADWGTWAFMFTSELPEADPQVRLEEQCGGAQSKTVC